MRDVIRQERRDRSSNDRRHARNEVRAIPAELAGVLTIPVRARRRRPKPPVTLPALKWMK